MAAGKQYALDHDKPFASVKTDVDTDSDLSCLSLHSDSTVQTMQHNKAV